jgi:hypothetical protein
VWGPASAVAGPAGQLLGTFIPALGNTGLLGGSSNQQQQQQRVGGRGSQAAAAGGPLALVLSPEGRYIRWAAAGIGCGCGGPGSTGSLLQEFIGFGCSVVVVRGSPTSVSLDAGRGLAQFCVYAAGAGAARQREVRLFVACW